MTLQQLKDSAARISGFSEESVDSVFSAEIEEVLNELNRQYGKRFLVPRYTLTLNDHSGQYFDLPSAYVDGVIDLVLLDSNKILPVLTPEEATQINPDRNTWTDTDTPRYAEIRPEQPERVYLWPNPPASGVDIQIRYARPPQPLQRGDDEPWDGQAEFHHRLLAYAAALAMVEMRTGEEARAIDLDPNPYGPLNAIRYLASKVQKMEQEAENDLLNFGGVTAYDIWGLNGNVPVSFPY